MKALKYFANCKTLEEIKKLYKELAMKFHPDREGGNLLIMQEVNAEYNEICNNPYYSNLFNSKESNNSNESSEDQREANRKAYMVFAEIINKIINFEGIIIEVIGQWVWVSGNTYPYKDKLKEFGFCFAPVKKMWFYRSEENKTCSFHRPKSIDSIRRKYGSEVVSNERLYLA
jgi:curved DNA-binding protein CbpA